jgi:hypothetical protein
MSTKILAKRLLDFLNQKEDFETQAVLKKLSCVKTSTLKHEHSDLETPKDFKLSKPPVTQAANTSLKEQAPLAVKPQVAKLSIYDKLSEKVKKSCPELRIKEHANFKKAGIPDCDVIVLTDQTVPDVYQALAKAVDKQLALTEVIFLDSSLMADLLTKTYKLALVSPHAKNVSSFMQHVKITGKKQAYIGSTPLIFLDEPSSLSTNVTNKQRLWQSIKILLS